MSLASLTFNALFAQTTSVEAIAILLATDYLASDPGGVPTDLTGFGVLEYLGYNNNGHTANDGVSYRGLLRDPSNHSTYLQPYQVGDTLAELFEEDKNAFLQAYYSGPRRAALLNSRPTTSASDPALSVVVPTWAATGQTTPNLFHAFHGPQWAIGAHESTIYNVVDARTVDVTNGASGSGYYAGTIAFFYDNSNLTYLRWAKVVSYSGSPTKRIVFDRDITPTPSIGDKFVFLTPISDFKTAMLALPAGKRFIRISSLYVAPVKIGGVVKSAWLDAHFLGTVATDGETGIEDTIMDQFRTSALPLYFAELEAQDVPIDGVMNDEEQIPFLWSNYAPGGVFSHYYVGEAETLAEFTGPDTQDDLGFQLDQIDEIRAGASYISNANHREWNTRWNDYLFKRHAEHTQQVYEAIAESYPDIWFSDYETCRRVPQHQPAGRSFSFMPFRGPGYACGTHQSNHPYSANELPFSVRDNAYLRPAVGASWVLPNLTGENTSDPATKWAAFESNLMICKSMFLASTLPIAMWTHYKSYYPTHSDSTLFEERLFHFWLHGCLLQYWNGDGTADDLPVQNAAAEFQAAVEKSVVRCRSFEPIVFDQDLIATAADVGGRVVWRVTVNPTLTPSTNLADGVLTISAGSTELAIPGGTLYTPGSPVSTLGYWVRQNPPYAPAKPVFFTGSQVRQAGGTAPRVLI